MSDFADRLLKANDQALKEAQRQLAQSPATDSIATVAFEISLDEKKLRKTQVLEEDANGPTAE